MLRPVTRHYEEGFRELPNGGVFPDKRVAQVSMQSGAHTETIDVPPLMRNALGAGMCALALRGKVLFTEAMLSGDTLIWDDPVQIPDSQQEYYPLEPMEEYIDVQDDMGV